MRGARSAALAATCAIVFSGCGTIANLASGNPDVPFGGVRRDLTMIETPRGTPSGIGLVPSMQVFLMPAEMSLSVVGDIVTLPLAISMHHSDPYVPIDGHEREEQPVAPPNANDGPVH